MKTLEERCKDLNLELVAMENDLIINLDGTLLFTRRCLDFWSMYIMESMNK